MAVAGGASYLVQRDRVDARIDAALRQEISEFRTYAVTLVDASTGKPFTRVRDVLRAALQRNVPDEHESFLTLLDGEVAFFPQAGPIRLEGERVLVAVVAAIPTDAEGVMGQVESSDLGTLRYAAVTVTVSGDPAVGTYIVGYAADLEHAELLDGMRTFLVVAMFSLLLVGLAGWVVAGRLLRPVRLLRDAARQISETDLAQRIEVKGTDDVSDLARTFNAMLDRLQEAFESQREFLDDAGQELRTPVTILQGHLEKARALEERRWQLDSMATGSVRGDGQRLTQALLQQLAANAVRFTGDSDTVAVGSRLTQGSVVLWVRDSGPGVAPEDVATIFKRFGRASAGRGPDGSGLGLAIVSAIAEAHGGRVNLRSTPGRGATFALVLPALPAPQDRPAAPAPPVLVEDRS